MKTITAVLFAAVMGLGSVSFAAAPVQASEKATVHKCDKAGSPCTTGKDCKASHCKAEKKSTEKAPKK